MNERDALNAALRALGQIDKLVATPEDPEGACEEVADITGDVIGELARAGYHA